MTKKSNHLNDCISFRNEKPQEPPCCDWISLSQALTWIAFSNSMNNHHLANLLVSTTGREAHAAQLELAHAVRELTNLGRERKVELTGKYVEALHADEGQSQRHAIPPRDLGEFRQFDLVHDGFRRGDGHAFRFTGEGAEWVVRAQAREAYHSIEVCRAALLAEFQPPPVTRMLYEEVVQWCKNWIAAGKGSGMDKAWPDFEPHPRRMGISRDTFRNAWNEAKGLKRM